MKIPARYAPIAFGALLSAIMVALVSAFVLATSRGIHAGFLAQWLRSCATSVTATNATGQVVAPWVRRVVGRVTAQA